VGLFIETNNLEKMRIVELSKLITKLKIILDELCDTVEDIENSKERLIISKCLDELIIEYMNISVEN